LGGDNLYEYAPNPIVWIDPLGLAGNRWQLGRYADMKGGGLQGHEFVRHKVLEGIGCGKSRNSDNPSIALT
jgi:uncharacterized protein RhaS with RHS repeats